jgi:superoxide dismutase
VEKSMYFLFVPFLLSLQTVRVGVLQEGGGEPPHAKLGWAIDEHFGSFEALIKKMNAEGAALQGSGWVVCTSFLALFYRKEFMS